MFRALARESPPWPFFGLGSSYARCRWHDSSSKLSWLLLPLPFLRHFPHTLHAQVGHARTADANVRPAKWMLRYTRLDRTRLSWHPVSLTMDSTLYVRSSPGTLLAIHGWHFSAVLPVRSIVTSIIIVAQESHCHARTTCKLRSTQHLAVCKSFTAREMHICNGESASFH
jgi:hypothetical protein